MGVGSEACSFLTAKGPRQIIPKRRFLTRKLENKNKNTVVLEK